VKHCCTPNQKKSSAARKKSTVSQTLVAADIHLDKNGWDFRPPMTKQHKRPSRFAKRPNRYRLIFIEVYRRQLNFLSGTAGYAVTTCKNKSGLDQDHKSTLDNPSGLCPL
jgi:hypothetical protein